MFKRLLGKYPEKFEVEVWEKGPVAGGVASSFKIDDDGLYINDGVQGGTPSYRNTLLLHKVRGDLAIQSQFCFITNLTQFSFIFTKGAWI